MKKTKRVTLPKVSANVVAQNLKKGLGEDKAFRVADSIAKNTNSINIGDVNGDIFTAKELARNANFWTQVRNILK